MITMVRRGTRDPAVPAVPAGPPGLDRLLGDLRVPEPPGFVDAVLARTGIAPAGIARAGTAPAGTAPAGPPPEDRYALVDGPVGPVYVAFGPAGVTMVLTAEAAGGGPEAFERAYRARTGRAARRTGAAPRAVVTALRTGRARRLAFDLRGLSEFERDVLAKAGEIPRGQVRPYAWIAREIGRPGAVRAVGSALGRNPVPLLIPCHRVTRADGRVGQYVFGPSVKRALLRGEGVDLDELERLAHRRTAYIGSDTTRIFCHPTCAHARRITPAHRVGFRDARAAAVAGYRPCKACRPPAAAA